MDFLNKLRAALRRFMQGRSGIDQLGIALLYAFIALNILSLFPLLRFLGTLDLLLLVYVIYRALSRDTARRRQENQWFLTKVSGWTLKLRQAVTRLKNRRQYAYFSCPECKAKLRLPRGVGEVTVTCGKCGHKFKKRA